MNARFTSGLVASLLAATLAWAATNLNSSRSNIYRLTYSTDLVSASQAKAILAELDKAGPMDEARMKVWMTNNFRRFGVAPDKVKKMVVVPRGKDVKEIAVILLTRPEDEAAAMAVTVKSSKSNTSD